MLAFSAFSNLASASQCLNKPRTVPKAQ
jgi:hypothetical protein